MAIYPLIACAVAGVFGVADANAFLQVQPKHDSTVALEDVQNALRVRLSNLAESAQLQEAKTVLQPMYVALPKNEHGNVDAATVRYALHRYFVQRNGWYMRGLEPAGKAWNASSPSDIMKDRVPAYIQSLVEDGVHGQGLNLHELAVFATTLADLVHKEASHVVQSVYKALKLKMDSPTPRRWSDRAVTAYLLAYLMGDFAAPRNIEEFELLEKDIVLMYPAWEETSMWVQDFRMTHDFMQKSRRNPFTPFQDTFESNVGFVQELGHHFGSFQNLECAQLKRKLIDMEYQGSGRVRLSQFYAGGLDGDWTFTESVDYLRSLGALDENDPKRPSVIITNYITSPTNCLTASGFYNVCCQDECEGLMRHIEVAIAAPIASPGHIADVVSGLQSDTIYAPRNLSVGLLNRLNEMADVHGGRVPLHGRLFAQWIHHAYPRECPYPHVVGTVNPMAPEEWMARKGVDDTGESMEVMRQYYESHREEDDKEQSLPWAAVEDLVAEHTVAHQDPPQNSGSLRWVMAVMALASFAVPLMRASRVAVGADAGGKPAGMMV